MKVGFSGITSRIPTPMCLSKNYLKMCWFSSLTSSFTITYFDKERSALTHPESYSGVLAWDKNTLRYQTENRSHVLKYWCRETSYDKVMVSLWQGSLSVLILYAFGLRQSLA